MSALRTAARRIRRALRAHREGVRTAVLVLLAAGVLVQAGALWARVLTRESIPWDGVRSWLAEADYGEPDTDNSACALPVRFAARGKTGLYGIQYNTEGLKAAYEQTADVWAQAYQNAAQAAPATSAQYREALRDSESGALLCAQTQVQDSLFEAAVSQFTPNGCALAADEEGSEVSPDLLYVPGGETFDVISFQPYTGGQGMEELLTAFRMDAQLALDNAYGADGVMVYTAGSSTIRIAEDGSMRYEGASVRLPVTRGHDRLMQCVQTGYELTGMALEAIDCGASPALIRAYTHPDSGRYIVVYGMQIGGVPVDNAVTGYFARYEFEGGRLARANLALRTCQTTGETVAIMPEKQAAASLDAPWDAVLSLRYVDPAVGTDSLWEQLYDDGTDGLWDAESGETDGWQDTPAGEDGWEDVPAGGQTDDSLTTAWYDTTGTPVSPQWYVLDYGETDELPAFGRTFAPEDIVAVQPDFDRMIQGGGAA